MAWCRPAGSGRTGGLQCAPVSISQDKDSAKPFGWQTSNRDDHRLDLALISERLTGRTGKVVMSGVSDTPKPKPALNIGSVLCVDSEAFDRFGRVLRHLLVGLVDQAIPVRVVSSDPRVKALSMGPVTTLVHQRLVWPNIGRRIERLLDDLSPQPPTLVHAMSSASYRVGCAVAEAFDADLVLQVTSIGDCDAIANISGHRVGRYAAFSIPLQRVLEEQLKVPAETVDLIHPGMLASQHLACFSEPQRLPTILCPAPLQRHSNVDHLIEAAAILRKQGLEFMLFLLGSGKHEPVMRRLIRTHDLLACVTVSRPSGDLTETLNSGDIFVQPAVASGFSDEVLQAMAAGLAVVTSPNAMVDFCRDGETVIVCDRTEPKQLAAVLADLLRDHSRAREIAAAGMEHVRQHHAISGMAEQIADTYRKLALTRATFSIKE